MAHLQATYSNHDLTFSSDPEVSAGKGAPSEYLKPTISLLRSYCHMGILHLDPKISLQTFGKGRPDPGESGWGRGCV